MCSFGYKPRSNVSKPILAGSCASKAGTSHHPSSYRMKLEFQWSSVSCVGGVWSHLSVVFVTLSAVFILLLSRREMPVGALLGVSIIKQ